MVYPCNLKLILYPMCWQFPEMDFTGASWNSMRNVAEHWQLTQRIDWPRDIASCDSCSAVAHFSTLFPHFWFRKILQIPSGVPTTDAAVQRSRVLSLEGPQRQPPSRATPSLHFSSPIFQAAHSCRFCGLWIYIFHWHSAFIGFYKYLMDFKWRLCCCRCRWHFIILLWRGCLAPLRVKWSAYMVISIHDSCQPARGSFAASCRFGLDSIGKGNKSRLTTEIGK